MDMVAAHNQKQGSVSREYFCRICVIGHEAYTGCSKGAKIIATLPSATSSAITSIVAELMAETHSQSVQPVYQIDGVGYCTIHITVTTARTGSEEIYSLDRKLGLDKISILTPCITAIRAAITEQ